MRQTMRRGQTKETKLDSLRFQRDEEEDDRKMKSEDKAGSKDKKWKKKKKEEKGKEEVLYDSMKTQHFPSIVYDIILFEQMK